MQKRIKLQKIFILVFAVIISVLLIGLLLGRNDLISVYVVNSDNIDPSKPLIEQTNLLKTVNVSKKDLGDLSGKLVTSQQQFNHGEKLVVPLKKGSMISVDLLSATKPGGQFASETPVYHTIFTLPDGKTSLPPGVEAGDRIDINLIYSKDKAAIVEGLLLHNVKIESIVENTLYLSVSQKEYAELTVAQQIGTFSLQLPGTKDVPLCSEKLSSLEKDKSVELAKVDKNKKWSTSKKDEEKQKIEDQYKNLELNAECYNENDKPNAVNSQDILNQVFSNASRVTPVEGQTNQNGSTTTNVQNNQTTGNTVVSTTTNTNSNGK